MGKHWVGGTEMTTPYQDGGVVYVRCRVLGITRMASSEPMRMMLHPCDKRGEPIGEKLLVQDMSEEGHCEPVLTAKQMVEGIRGKA